MKRIYLSVAAWATRHANITPPQHDPHCCPRCHQKVGATGWHITQREHDSCSGRVEPLAKMIDTEAL